MLMVPATHGVLTSLPPGYTNLTYRGITFPSNRLPGSLPLTANRCCIVAMDCGSGSPTTMTVNGVAATKIIDNGTDFSAGAIWLGLFAARVGTTDSISFPGSYEIVTDAQAAFSLWEVYMTSIVAHSTGHGFNPSSLAPLALSGVTIPTNGFAVLLGSSYGGAGFGNIASVDQGFVMHVGDQQVADAQVTTAFSGTVTVTWSGGTPPASAILASFAGDGS
jgi:hypothetical protein